MYIDNSITSKSLITINQYFPQLTQKLQLRKAALVNTSTLTEDEKIELMPCFVPEIMSSEESNINDEGGKIITRPFSWRSETVTKLFLRLDQKSNCHRSISREMDYKREVGMPSDRPQPLSLDKWIYRQ